jgi:hypothetical protein
METINVFSFDELSDRAKQKARDDLRVNLDYPFFDDAQESLNSFCALYGVKVLDYCLSDDYRAFVRTDASNQNFRGLKLKDVQRDNDLTGYCMDCTLTYTFYDTFKKTGDALASFNDAIDEFLIDVRRDIEWHFSDDYIQELMDINEWRFLESGTFAR